MPHTSVQVQRIIKQTKDHHKQPISYTHTHTHRLATNDDIYSILTPTLMKGRMLAVRAAGILMMNWFTQDMA